MGLSINNPTGTPANVAYVKRELINEFHSQVQKTRRISLGSGPKIQEVKR
jgi:hypothetical protein